MKFLCSEEGNGYLEKILIIGAFALIVTAALSTMGSSADSKLKEQAQFTAGLHSKVGGQTPHGAGARDSARNRSTQRLGHGPATSQQTKVFSRQVGDQPLRFVGKDYPSNSQQSLAAVGTAQSTSTASALISTSNDRSLLHAHSDDPLFGGAFREKRKYAEARRWDPRWYEYPATAGILNGIGVTAIAALVGLVSEDSAQFARDVSANGKRRDLQGNITAAHYAEGLSFAGTLAADAAFTVTRLATKIIGRGKVARSARTTEAIDPRIQALDTMDPRIRPYQLNVKGWAVGTEYAEGAARIVDDAVEGLRSGRFAKGTDLMDTIARARAEMARAANDSAADMFGKLRQPEFFGMAKNEADALNMVTPIRGRYGAYLGRLGEESIVIMAKLPDGSTVRLTESGMIDGAKQWLHGDPVAIPKIRKHLNTLIAKANQPGLSDAERLDHLARVHWWTANSMPYARGSAAIADMTVRSIAKAHNMKMPAYREGIIPDIESFFYKNPDDFVEAYRGFF